MKINKSISLLFFLIITHLSAQAQDEFSMADSFYDEGKIYVVIAVLLIIFTGIIAYLVHLDRKLKKLEQKQQES